MPTTVTILAILIVTLCPCQGECPIECYCDETTICSGDKILTRLPLIPPNNNWNDQQQILITRLELHDFLIEHLDKTQFLRLISNLTEFRLTSNPRLSSIDNDTFSWPGGHDISGGRGGGRIGDNASSIAEDDDDSREVDSLTTLPLNLRKLDLSGNGLKYFVAGGKLKRLRVLDLSSNRLQQVYLLQHLHNLESVNLRDNRIHFLQPTLFQNLRNLQYINLDSNKIGRLDPTTFSNLPSLAHLILSSNPIENLLPGFVWNSRVQFVDVSRVGLSHIPTSFTTSVRDFRCANNNLTIIRQSDFESYPNVGLLVLDENFIETVEDDAFGRLDFLARLWINGNRLTRVPQNLPPSLRSLQVEDNRISSISAGDFRTLSSLEELNLHGNQIIAIPANTLSNLLNLRNLDLRSNQLDTIERDSFKNLTRLETLDLSQNPIKVIVRGVFQDLQKLSLLHLSRLREKNVDFDPASFHSLVNLEILELDDSPSLTQMILRESALGYFMSLIELNLQRCDLQDLHLVSSSLLDSPLFDSLRVVKLSGNPWDCSDSSDSETQNEFKEFLTLLRKKVIVDADQMICADPKGIKVISAAINSTLNDTHRGGGGRKNKPNITTTTVNALDTSSVTHIVSSNSVTSSSSKLINDTIFYTTTSSTPAILQSKTTTRIITPESLTVSTEGGGGTTSTLTVDSHNNTTTSPSPPKSPAASSSSSIGLGITEKPTRSYFPDQTPRPTTARRTTTTRMEGTLPISNKDDESRHKLFSVSDTPDQDENMAQQHGASSSRTNKKTNDDNAIIDEERNPTSFYGRQHYSEPTQRFGGSIDGFPAFPDDPVAKEPHTSSTKNSLHPKPSYLKSSQSRMGYENQSIPSANSAVILKTLIISAVACLLSILFLLLLSLAVYRFSTWKPKRRPISLSMRKWDKRGEECDSDNVLYRNFNPHNRGPTGIYSRLGDQDTVELSGITNRLYFENEDIYHIT